MENKLAEIQAKVKAPKGQFNSFGKYNYRSAEDILEAVKQVVNPMGYSITISDTIINVGDRYYIKATATLTNGKETYSTDGYAREEESKKGMDGSQVTGACSSYARKYALNGLFALDDTKDSDATNTHGKDEVKVIKVEAKPLGYYKRIIDSLDSIEGCKSFYNDYLADIQSNPNILPLLSTKKLSFTINQPIK
jgi:hypothetical protein